METSDILQLFIAVFATNGLWNFLIALIDHKKGKKENIKEEIAHIKAENETLKEALRSLLYNAIIIRCDEVIARGYCYDDEYEVLKNMMTPYLKIDGNGMAKKKFGIVETMPMKVRVDKNDN